MLHTKVTNDVQFRVPSGNSLDWIPWLSDVARLVEEIRLEDIDEGAELQLTPSGDGKYVIRPINCRITGYDEREPEDDCERMKEEVEGRVTITEHNIFLSTWVTLFYNRVINQEPKRRALQ